MPVVWLSGPTRMPRANSNSWERRCWNKADEQKSLNPVQIRRHHGSEDVGEVLGARFSNAGHLAQLVGKCPQCVEVLGRKQIGIGISHDDELVAAEERFAFAIVEQVRIVECVERLDRMLQRQLRCLRKRQRRQQDRGQQEPDAIADQKIRKRNKSVVSRTLGHGVSAASTGRKAIRSA